MSATHPETKLIPLLRGELNGRQRARVTAHLDGCTLCRSRIDVLAGTLHLVAQQLEQLPRPEPGAYRDELRRRLTAREEESTPRLTWRPAFIWGSFAATGLAIALIAFVALRDQGNPSMPLPSIARLALADSDADEIARTDVGLLRNYPMVERLDMLDDDNYDVIEHLDQLAPIAQTHEIQRL